MKYELEDTVEWMKSDNFAIRLKAEYWQVVIRINKLKKYTENFNRNASRLLVAQYNIMNAYRAILKERAESYCIDLDDEEVDFK